MITVSPFRKLRWKHWWAMPFAAFFVICVPFVLTLHGGDNSYFYQALFIDPVLGFAAGYVFYLATTKPFRTGFSRMQFALALSVLVIIKDSGILFALLSVLCALCIRRAEEKTPLTTLLKGLLLPVSLMLLSYLIWKGLLAFYNISNHIPLHPAIPTAAFIGDFPEVLVRAPIINLIVIRFSFLVYVLILLAMSVLLDVWLKPYSRANCLWSFLLVTLSFLFFSYGYVIIFHHATYEMILDLSYYRYFTTLTAAYLIFCFLRYLPVVFEKIPADRNVIRLPVFVLSILACFFGAFVLDYWKPDYDTMLLIRNRNP